MNPYTEESVRVGLRRLCALVEADAYIDADSERRLPFVVMAYARWIHAELRELRDTARRNGP